MTDGSLSHPPPKIDPTSPFYLGPQDKPGDFITPVRLKLDNFDDWAHAIYIALSSRRKFGFLDGTITDIVFPATKDDWVTIHCMLVSWLMNTIAPEVTSLLSNYDNAKRLWDDLNERFCVVNGPRIQQLKAELSRCEQTKNMTVAIYFGKLKVLWDDLAKYEPLISCKCGLCTCNVSKQHEERQENDRLQQFLLGLCSDYYAPLRSTILSQDPLPSLNRAYQQVSQDERVRGIAQDKEDTMPVAGFAVRLETKTKPRLSKAEKAALICSHCHKPGHDSSSCFDLHGVPEWYVEKYGGEPKSGQKAKTFTNNGRGRGNAKANATPSQPSPATSTVASTVQQPSGFTAEQWQSLVTAFGTPPLPPNRLNGPTNEGGDWHG